GLHEQEASIDALVAYLSRVQQKAAADLVEAEENVRRLTALVYTNSSTGWQASAFLDVQSALDASRVDKLGTSLTEQLVDAEHRAEVARKRASEVSTKLAYQRVGVDTRLHQLETVDLPATQREVRVLSETAASTVAGAAVVGLNIPVATLDAYLRAEATLGREQPSCGITWWMIAGIGRVESNHGRYGGSQPGAHGDVVPRIVGIPLDGSPGVAAIPDSDKGVWDLDPTWDRAVGPMQFIPGTWRRWKADGDGNGVMDPNNVYDAALGAARYLCAAGGHLGDDASLLRAYLSYNHSDAYASNVLDGARGYQSI